jgi:hypothetical protein
MKRRLTISGVVVSAVMLLAMNVHPPRVNAEESGMTKVTTIEGISEYQLENGMKVLLFPDPSSSKVTVNLTLFVGSRHEGYGEAGMAHLLEHMLFKGLPTIPTFRKFSPSGEPILMAQPGLIAPTITKHFPRATKISNLQFGWKPIA